MALIGTVASLSMNMDGSMANAKMVNSTWDSTEGRRHLIELMGNDQPMVFLISLTG